MVDKKQGLHRKGKRASSTADLVKASLDMIKSARHLIDIQKDDFIRAGTYRITRQRLGQFETRLQKLRRKTGSDTEIGKIAQEVAWLIGDLTKSLVRCLLSFLGWHQHATEGLNMGTERL